MKRPLFLTSVVLGVALAFDLLAGVNLKNGNFYVSYTDSIVNVKSNQTITVVRTYNSRATKNGWFGFGWGSGFETYLQTLPEEVTCHENGAGALTALLAPDSEPRVVAGIDFLCDLLVEQRVLAAASELNSFRLKIANNAELRRSWLRSYGWDNLRAQHPWQVGTTFGNSGGTKNSFVRLGQDGFQRYTWQGRCPTCGITHGSGFTGELFDIRGRLVRTTDQDGNSVRVLRDDRGRWIRLMANEERFITLQFDNAGHVVELTASDGKRATYVYRGKNLVKSTDVCGNTYEYDYDDDGNMLQIRYSDGTSMRMCYEPATQSLSEIVQPEGTKTQYRYWNDPTQRDDHYGTDVMRSTNGVCWTNRYGYEIKTVPNTGQRYTHRLVTEVNGVRTEVTYDLDVKTRELSSFQGNSVATEFISGTQWPAAMRIFRKGSTNEAAIIALSYAPDQSLQALELLVSKTNRWAFRMNAAGYLSTAELAQGGKIVFRHESSRQDSELGLLAESTWKPATNSLVGLQWIAPGANTPGTADPPVRLSPELDNVLTQLQHETDCWLSGTRYRAFLRHGRLVQLKTAWWRE
jgi:YD repeat-containing protein